MWFFENVNRNLRIQNLTVNFMPYWWARNYGLEYGEKMMFDPDYRMDAHRTMRRLFHDRFGRDIGAGEADPTRVFVPPDWDNTYFQAMMGFEVRYPADQYPVAHGQLTAQRVEGLTVPRNIWSVFPFTEVMKQAMYMNRVLGTDEPPQMRTRGILNEAVQLRGSDFYGDLLDDDLEEANQKVLTFVGDVIQAQLMENKMTNPHASHIMMNCTVGIAGPYAYQTHVLRHDQALYEFCNKQGIPVGIHHCGKFDDFRSLYADMPEVSFLEIGHQSHIRPVLEQHPHAQVQYIFSTQLMRCGTPSQVRQAVLQILDEVAGCEHRFSLSAADIEYGTPDDNLLELVATLRA